MAIYPKVNGAYKTATNCKVKVAGAWKQAQKIYTKVNGAWRECWRNSTVIVVKNNNSFNIRITGYDGTLVQNVEIRNLNLRLYNKSTGALCGETHYDVVKISRDVKPNLTVSRSGTDWSAAFMPHIVDPNITVYPTLAPSANSVYAEFEFDEVVKV